MNTLAERSRDIPSSSRPWLLLWQRCVLVAMAALGFFAPFSTAGVSISGVILIVLVLLRPHQLRQARPWAQPVMAIGLVLLAYIAVHTLWVTGFNAKALSAINRYHELLLAPLLFVLMLDPRHRRTFLQAFAVGTLLLATAYWLLHAGSWASPIGNALSARRISGGFALALSAFLLLIQSRESDRPWLLRLAAAYLASAVLLAMDGRTGQLVLLVLAAFTAWRLVPGRLRWPVAVAGPLVLLAIVFGLGASKGRLQETVESHSAAVAPEGFSSTAIRVELSKLAYDLARRHGAAGAGYANYGPVQLEAAEARYGPDPARSAYLKSYWIRIANPHNEYAMQLIGGGVAALAIFLAWLGGACRQALRMQGPARDLLLGTVLAFATASIFNSALMDFIEGHIFAAMLAALLAAGSGAAVAARGPRSVLVVATRQIGDVLLTTPLIRRAREQWPQARIDVLGFQRTLGMLAGNPDVSQRIEIAPRLGARGTLALLRRLWGRYDVAVIADIGDRAHLLGWIAARQRSGVLPGQGGSNWWKRLLLRHAVVAAGDRGSVHVVREKLALLDPWMAGSATAASAVVAPPAAALPADLQSAMGTGPVVVHVPSMWAYKQWPIGHFAALITGLLADGRQVVLTGSAGARDQECIEPLRSLGAAPRLLDVSGRLDFPQLVTLLKQASLFIGPDTSVSHLAAAAGGPVLAIFGPTNPRRWAPWPAAAGSDIAIRDFAPSQRIGNVTILQGSYGCVPCGRAGCEDHRQSGSECLSSIGAERVLAQARSILQGG